MSIGCLLPRFWAMVTRKTHSTKMRHGAKFAEPPRFAEVKGD